MKYIIKCGDMYVKHTSASTLVWKQSFTNKQSEAKLFTRKFDADRRMRDIKFTYLRKPSSNDDEFTIKYYNKLISKLKTKVGDNLSPQDFMLVTIEE
jgi:hypothetical protein